MRSVSRSGFYRKFGIAVTQIGAYKWRNLFAILWPTMGKEFLRLLIKLWGTRPWNGSLIIWKGWWRKWQ